MEEIKKALIDLYLGVKIRELSEIDNMPDELIMEEEQKLNKLPIIEIIKIVNPGVKIFFCLQPKIKRHKRFIIKSTFSVFSDRDNLIILMHDCIVLPTLVKSIVFNCKTHLNTSFCLLLSLYT